MTDAVANREENKEIRKPILWCFTEPTRTLCQCLHRGVWRWVSQHSLFTGLHKKRAMTECLSAGGV